MSIYQHGFAARALPEDCAVDVCQRKGPPRQCAYQPQPVPLYLP